MGDARGKSIPHIEAAVRVVVLMLATEVSEPVVHRAAAQVICLGTGVVLSQVAPYEPQVGAAQQALEREHVHCNPANKR